MRVLLVASYELGHQPLHVAAPAAMLRERGHEVCCRDLSMQSWEPELVEWADRVAFSVPMHTAMRIARRGISAVRAQRPDLPVACYGLYAENTADVADRAISGETDDALVRWIEDVAGDEHATVHLDRAAATPSAPRPARDLLPPLERYAHLALGGEERVVGYVEASRGCAHRCRHCPVPVVYDGRTRIVAADSILADVAQQVEAGARHITFGDPDFLNAVHHSRRVVGALHDRFPDVTFDCTVKVEHVLKHEDLWDDIANAGCLFVVSAFESVDDATLERLDKGHTTADASRAVDILRDRGIEVRPSWMPFTPWTTLEHVQRLLEFVEAHDLVGNVDPVQYTIRLLLPRGSLLLGHPDMTPHLGDFDPERGSYAWRAADPAMDDLQVRLAALVEGRTTAGDPIPQIYNLVREACGLGVTAADARPGSRLTEPWFC